jgi:hypothetical protein
MAEIAPDSFKVRKNSRAGNNDEASKTQKKVGKKSVYGPGEREGGWQLREKIVRIFESAQGGQAVGKMENAL